jgi:hypothetical protein
MEAALQESFKSSFAGCCKVYHRFHAPGGSAWTNDLTLSDVYENARYANFTENHTANVKPEFKIEEELITCEVVGKTCKTSEGFYKLVGPYMND